MDGAVADLVSFAMSAEEYPKQAVRMRAWAARAFGIDKCEQADGPRVVKDFRRAK